MRRRLILTVTLAITALVMLGGVPASQAAPGSLRILFVSNEGPGDFTGFLPALSAMPGVAAVDTFDSNDATPSQEALSGFDLVVDTGDSSYDDPALYGNRLADYIDAGGSVIQFAYDNWDETGAHPTGRFESGGYAPFTPGPNDNAPTSLGQLLVPDSPLLAGVQSFTTIDNVTDPLASGATLLALFADGRNAIATKGRVVSLAASPEDTGDLDPVSAAAQLALNAGNVLGRHTIAVQKTGRGAGTVTSTPAGISCGTACSADFVGSAGLTLTAKAKKSSFTGWKGVTGCGKGSSCTFTPTANTTVTASFGCKTKKKKHKSSAESAKKKKCKKKKKKG
jgi:hypothetical protein